MTVAELNKKRTFEVEGALREVLVEGAKAQYMLLEYHPTTKEMRDTMRGMHILYAIPYGGKNVLGVVTVRKGKKFDTSVKEEFREWLGELPKIDAFVDKQLEALTTFLREMENQPLTKENLSRLENFSFSEEIL